VLFGRLLSVIASLLTKARIVISSVVRALLKIWILSNPPPGWPLTAYG